MKQEFKSTTMTIVSARNLSRGDVHRLFGFRPIYNGSFESYLVLEPLSESEQQELTQIQLEYRAYWETEKVSEGQVRLLAIAPLFRLAGYNEPPIRLETEEDIARIYIQDEDTYITGRLDIIAVNRQKVSNLKTLLWTLVVESKNSEASESAGVAQMLAYAYPSLKHQDFVWGLVSNGITYQFFYVRGGETPTYELMPNLFFFESDRAPIILQVLKAIRQL
jgi:hypothetical protein